jgi:hypothetical protein
MAEIQAASMKLLPPPEGHCRICAVKHRPDEAHNAQSLFYQMRFRMRYGRDCTWADAIAHLDERAQRFWIEHLNMARDNGLGNGYTEPPEGVAPIAEPIDG